MNERRILYVSSGRTFGGAEQVMLALAGAFARDGFDVLSTHHPRNDAFGAALAAHDIPAHALPETARRADAREFRDFVHGFAPDLVHIHRTWPLSDRHAAGAARRAGSRVIATEHVRIEEAGLRDRLAKRVLSRHDETIIAVSRAVRDSLTRFWGVDDARIVTIPNGVDLARFDRARNPAAGGEHFSRDARFRIGTIGRLERQKDIPTLVRAFAEARETGLAGELRIVGDGSERAAVERAIREHDLSGHVSIVPRIEDVPAFLAGLDLFVLPSLWEGLPLTILEAMASGTPIVATAVDGTREAIEHGVHGLLVPPGDPAALASAMREAANDREAAETRATAARERAEREFSFENVVARHREIYES